MAVGGPKIGVPRHGTGRWPLGSKEGVANVYVMAETPAPQTLVFWRVFKSSSVKACVLGHAGTPGNGQQARSQSGDNTAGTWARQGAVL